MCPCACSAWLGRAGRPIGRVWVRLICPWAVLSSSFARPPQGWGCPFLVLLFHFFLFFDLLLLHPHCLGVFLVSSPGCSGPWRCVVSLPPPRPPPFLFPPWFAPWDSVFLACCLFCPVWPWVFPPPAPLSLPLLLVLFPCCPLRFLSLIFFLLRAPVCLPRFSVVPALFGPMCCLRLLFVFVSAAEGAALRFICAVPACPAVLCAVLFLLLVFVPLLWCALWWWWCCPPPPPAVALSVCGVFRPGRSVGFSFACPCFLLCPAPTCGVVRCVVCELLCWRAAVRWFVLWSRCLLSCAVACCAVFVFAVPVCPAVCCRVVLPCCLLCAVPFLWPAVCCVTWLRSVVLCCCFVLSHVVVRCAVPVFGGPGRFCVVVSRVVVCLPVLCCLVRFVAVFSLFAALRWRGVLGCGAVVPCGAACGVLGCSSLCCLWWRILCGAVVFCAGLPSSCWPAVCSAVVCSLVGVWCYSLFFSAVLCWSGLLLWFSAARCALVMACVVACVPVWLRGPLCRCVLSCFVVPCFPMLCSVAPCVRGVPCCGALLPFLFRWWCLFVVAAFCFLCKIQKNVFASLKIHKNYTQRNTRASNNFILLHFGNLGAFGLSFHFTKNIATWKARHQQEAAGASRSRIQNKHIKGFISERCSSFLGAGLYSSCVPPSPCSTTCTPRLITLEGRKNISWTPKTLEGRQRPQRHQPRWHQSPNLLVNSVPSVPLRGLDDDSFGSLGAAFSKLHVPTPEGKAKEKYAGEGGAKGDCEGRHVNK